MRVGVPKEIKVHEYRVGLTPSSVREVMDMVSAVLGRDVDPEVVARRAGDPPATFASTERIATELGWSATRDLRAMVDSAWSAWRANA